MLEQSTNIVKKDQNDFSKELKDSSDKKIEEKPSSQQTISKEIKETHDHSTHPEVIHHAPHRETIKQNKEFSKKVVQHTQSVIPSQRPPITKVQKLQEEVTHYQKLFNELSYEVSKVVVGQKHILKEMLTAILANGHCLVEGIPGIAKTLLLRTLSVVTGSEFKRIQFTPDLLPTDIVGVTAYDEKKGFYTVKGPIFANFVLGDEINRAPPKVQSALLEGMQEKQVTIAKNSFQLPKPFFVMATQNPIEQMGTYPLPEAQIDRFIFKIVMKYPPMEDEAKILEQNISLRRFDDYNIIPVMQPDDIIRLQNDVKKIYLDPKIEKYIVRLVDSTRNPSRYNLEFGKYVEFGSSPRASIALYIASKAHALINGKTYVTPQDVKSIATSVFRHRLILNYEGQAEEIKNEDIVKEILSKVPVM